MRKYLILLCVFILVCGTIAYARMSLTVIAGENAGGGGASCVSGVNDSAIFDLTGGSSADAATINATSYLATRFDLPASYTITKYILHVTDVDQGGTVTCSIFTDGGGDTPVSLISNTDVAVGNANITDHPTYEDQEFVLATPQSLGTDTYWLHCIGSGGGNDFLSYIVTKAGIVTGVDYSGGYYATHGGAVALYGCAD